VKRKWIAFVVLTICLLVVGGCTINQNLTPSARYYAALKFFNDTVEQYSLQLTYQTPQTQAVWRGKINPLIRLSSEALDAWGASIGTPEAGTAEATWLSLKTKLRQVLVSEGIIKIKEAS
jgi:hypothetical protein